MLWGCSAARAPAVAPPIGDEVAAPAAVGLEYLGAAVYRTGALRVPGESLVFGSISGLALDPQTKRWVGAMDATNRPRLAWMEIAVPAGQPVVSPVAFTFLHGVPGLTPPGILEALDMESIVVLPDGSFLSTNEGHTDRDGLAHQPMVVRIARDGGVTGVVRPRAHFTIDAADESHGVRHNLGLESLTRTPDGRLISGLEQPLAQDGPMSTIGRGGLVRLVEFVPQGDSWTPGREWAYALDPTPLRRGYRGPCQDGENGLSELFALDDTRFIALERACLVGAGRTALNPVRLNLVDVDGADDVSSRVSLAGVTTIRLATKRLLLDLTTLTDRVPMALRTMSNFEGLAAGPPAPDGSPTLIVISDDNFRASQTFAVMWLKLRLQ